MEKIENKVCNIFIDESYRSFNKALNQVKGTEDKNINEIYDNILVISDENVYKTQVDKFIDSLGAKFVSEYIVPAGEDSKCIETFEKGWHFGGCIYYSCSDSFAGDCSFALCVICTSQIPWRHQENTGSYRS